MVYNVVFLFLFMLGFYAILLKKSLIKMVIGLNIMEAATFFWVIATSNKWAQIPIYQPGNIGQAMNDPVPQALILTGIVIGASTTALLLTLIIELNKFADSIEIERMEGLGD